MFPLTEDLFTTFYIFSLYIYNKLLGERDTRNMGVYNVTLLAIRASKFKGCNASGSQFHQVQARALYPGTNKQSLWRCFSF